MSGHDKRMSGHVRTGHIRSDQVRSGHVKSGQVRSRPDLVDSYQLRLGQDKIVNFNNDEEDSI